MILVDFKILTFANCHCRQVDANVKINPLGCLRALIDDPLMNIIIEKGDVSCKRRSRC